MIFVKGLSQENTKNYILWAVTVASQER